MDENDIKLLAEIESLKSQIAELRMAQAGMENVGGAAVGIGEMLVPIGNVPGAGVTLPPGPFTPVYEEPEEDEEEPTYIVTGFTNCYWQNCGKTILMSDQTIPGANGFIALRAGATPSTAGQATLQCYADLAALQAAQDDVAYFTIPLYRVADSKITLDMRRMPNVYLAEVLT